MILMATGLVGCQTASGDAIGGRLSGSLDRMWRGAAAMLGSEFERSSRFLDRTLAVPLDPGARLTSLVGHAGAELTGISSRVQRMPGRIVAFAGGEVTDSIKRVRALGDGENPMIDELRGGPLLARWRDGVIAFVRALDTSHYILPGPGDPDRSADPGALTRRETWIERLLRRF